MFRTLKVVLCERNTNGVNAWIQILSSAYKCSLNLSHNVGHTWFHKDEGKILMEIPNLKMKFQNQNITLKAKLEFSTMMVTCDRTYIAAVNWTVFVNVKEATHQIDSLSNQSTSVISRHLLKVLQKQWNTIHVVSIKIHSHWPMLPEGSTPDITNK